jgi:hypothetical protein
MAESKIKRMKEIIDYLEVNNYFHRFVSRDFKSVYKNHVIVALESYQRFDAEWKKFNDLNLTWGCSLTYHCAVGGNYIMIEVL